MKTITCNENTDICKKCGGLCCQLYAGMAHPNQVGAPDTNLLERSLTEKIKSGKWCFDIWEGTGEKHNPNVYMLRPKHKDTKNIVDTSYGYECIFWNSKEGCDLSFEDRPYQCQQLIPKRKGLGACKQLFSKEDARNVWLPYQTTVLKVIKNFRGY